MTEERVVERERVPAGHCILESIDDGPYGLLGGNNCIMHVCFCINTSWAYFLTMRVTYCM